MPSDGHADRHDDQSADGQAARPHRAEAEHRSRQECYDDLRALVPEEKSASAQQAAADEEAASDTWNERVTESRWMWSEYQRKWPPEDRPPVEESDDDPEVTARVEAACDRIADLASAIQR